ncbi:LacI family DNA-binding transcriptional regulator [Ktedonospora formicarum]|uniref:Catabolite control protein A n=1 Tax=Ktedonospora formicarum TaxID=2778364 RepID=A0A8J3I5H5_9CHLR|nr:LacI family DNA-binding transcriptional regulator [Ktedonospora formicarum]GHO50702.1 catabolite control protein A [Ktedonospora formicarum]
MRRKAVTIRDVAQLAEVSVSTVSQVLNGNMQYVREAKRERVLNAVRELRYRPNAIARSMVKRKTATVGVVFTSLVSNLFSPIIECIQDILRPHGYNIILASTPDAESEIQAINALKDQQVDGFIFVSFMYARLQSQSDHLLDLKEEGIPFVVINRPLEQEYDFNQIRFNHREAGYLATKHLIHLGHTSIATISGPLHHVPPWQSAIERQQGWLEALKEHNLEVVPEWIRDGNYTYQGGYEAACWLLEHWDIGRKRPTALFVANDEMTLGALRAFYYHGVQVPHEVALVTVGDPPYAAHMFPALTTFAHPLKEAGQIATRILIDQLHATDSLPTQKIMLSYQLHTRESCGTNPEPKSRGLIAH